MAVQITGFFFSSKLREEIKPEQYYSKYNLAIKQPEIDPWHLIWTPQVPLQVFPKCRAKSEPQVLSFIFKKKIEK